MWLDLYSYIAYLFADVQILLKTLALKKDIMWILNAPCKILNA